MKHRGTENTEEKRESVTYVYELLSIFRYLCGWIKVLPMWVNQSVTYVGELDHWTNLSLFFSVFSVPLCFIFLSLLSLYRSYHW